MRPKVFISYSKSNKRVEEIEEWANRLEGDGVDVVWDKTKLNLGQDPNFFMEKLQTDKTISSVIFVCDKTFKEKADSRKHGVGAESEIAASEIYRNPEQTKYIPVVHEFDKQHKPYLPVFLMSRIWIDFSTPDLVNENWKHLIKAINDNVIYRKSILDKPSENTSAGKETPTNLDPDKPANHSDKKTMPSTTSAKNITKTKVKLFTKILAKRNAIGILSIIFVFLGVIYSAHKSSESEDKKIYLENTKMYLPRDSTMTAEAKHTDYAVALSMTQSAILQIATLSPSLKYTESPELNLTPSSSERSQKILLEEKFLDNNNNWALYNDVDIKSKIIGGKYVHNISCPLNNDEYFCNYDFEVPDLFVKDFCIELDVAIKGLSPGANASIAFQFRRIEGNYYSLFFNDNGKYRFSLAYYSPLTNLLAETAIPSDIPISENFNRYGIFATSSKFTPLFNGVELDLIEDGNIDKKGSLFIVLYIERGYAATVEMDNLIVIDNTSGN